MYESPKLVRSAIPYTTLPPGSHTSSPLLSSLPLQHHISPSPPLTPCPYPSISCAPYPITTTQFSSSFALSGWQSSSPVWMPPPRHFLCGWNTPLPPYPFFHQTPSWIASEYHLSPSSLNPSSWYASLSQQNASRSPGSQNAASVPSLVRPL